jgi:glucokinase
VPTNRIPVLEVGGTHAIASWVESGSWHLVPGAYRVGLRGDAPAGDLLGALAACLTRLGPLTGRTLAAAVPGPFDYATGIALFEGVGKFDALRGVDVGAELRSRLAAPPERIVFLNDAEAFGLGEWLTGAGEGCERVVAITLGTGVGSAFVANGVIVSSGPDVPPDGHVYRLRIGDVPLEDVVSRRAILARYGADGVDVGEIATLAAAGDPRAVDAFVLPLRRLGTALAPWLHRFGAQMLVVGGAMSESWQLVEGALRDGLGAGAPPIAKSFDPDASAATGAAWHAVRGATGPRRTDAKGERQ